MIPDPSKPTDQQEMTVLVVLQSEWVSECVNDMAWPDQAWSVGWGIWSEAETDWLWLTEVRLAILSAEILFEEHGMIERW